ncbi:MAG TPA: hypothetical protein PKN32_00010 [Bacteroidales bacterium]|nr:hypothetical protein [Bacteroidales bacterium]
MEKSKFLITFLKILVVLVILFSVQLQAKIYDEDSVKIVITQTDRITTTSLYFELGGKLFPSLNVDFRKRENFALSVGIGFWTDSEEHEQLIFAPSVNAYYLFGKMNRIEIGGGTGTFISTYEGFASLLIFGDVGYRYQKKKGLFFRAGFTPFIGIPINGKSRFLAMPWVGLSLGYSFSK